MDQKSIDSIISYLKQSLIQHGVCVDSIALYGSALKGNMNQDSDLDLIIISSNFIGLDIFERAKLTMKPEMDTLKKFKIPLDVINLTTEEYNESNIKLYYRPKIVA